MMWLKSKPCNCLAQFNIVYPLKTAANDNTNAWDLPEKNSSAAPSCQTWETTNSGRLPATPSNMDTLTVAHSTGAVNLVWLCHLRFVTNQTYCSHAAIQRSNETCGYVTILYPISEDSHKNSFSLFELEKWDNVGNIMNHPITDNNSGCSNFLGPISSPHQHFKSSWIWLRRSPIRRNRDISANPWHSFCDILSQLILQIR